MMIMIGIRICETCIGKGLRSANEKGRILDKHWTGNSIKLL